MAIQGSLMNLLYAREVKPEHGGFTWGLGLASAIVTSVVLILRIWSRLLNRSQRFGADDWMAVAAWPFVIGQALAIMYSFRWGVGIHASQLTDEEFTKVNQLTLVILIMYCFNIVFIRVSVSLYYSRIFAANKTFGKFVWLNIGVNVAWLLAIMFAAIFQCKTPAAMWDKAVTGVHCDPPIEHQHICSFSSVLLDLIVLLLPLPMIWKLHLKTTKKWEIFAIFIVGYCVPVLTIGRLISTMITGDALNTDPTWEFVNILYWLLLETTIAYIGVCTPAILFLVRRWQSAGFLAIFHSRFVSKSNASDTDANTDTKPSLNSKHYLESKDVEVSVHASEVRSSLDEEASGFENGHGQGHEQRYGTAHGQASVYGQGGHTRNSSMGILQTRTYTVTRS